MLSEKPNDNFSWRNKLDELDCLPGEIFSDKAEAWEKLHKRLRGNSTRRKAAWYWIAAACLLLIILIPWGIHKKEPVLVKIKSGRYQIIPPVLKKSSAQSMDTGSETGISLVPVKTTSGKYVMGKRENTNNPGIKINAKDTLSVDAIVDQNRTGSSVVVDPIPSFDSVVVAITPVFVKKKLRVVHVNELGVAVEDDSQDARYAERPSYYRRLTNQNGDIFSNPSINSHTYANDLLKIKISPQN